MAGLAFASTISLAAMARALLPCAPLSDVDVLHTPQFLPSAWAAPSAAQRADATSAATELRRELSRAQDPGACSAQRLVRCDVFEAGLGSTISSMLKPLMRASELGRALLSPALRGFASTTACAQQDFSCFFKPLSACEVDSSATAAAARRDAPFLADLDADADGGYDPDDLHRAKSYSLHGATVIPASVRAQGLFWWVSQLLAFVMRPALALQARFDDVWQRVRWEERTASASLVVGLHVRRGDSCSTAEQHRTARRCDSLDVYLPHLRGVVARYASGGGRVAVFLATDSADVLRDAQRYRAEFDWIIAPPGAYRGPWPSDATWDDVIRCSGCRQERKREEKEGSCAMRGAHEEADTAAIREEMCGNCGDVPSVDGYEEAMSALVDIELLSQCDVLIGKFSSNLFRTAFARQHARSPSCVRPYVSLDAPWCFDFGLSVGKGVDGLSFPC